MLCFGLLVYRRLGVEACVSEFDSFWDSYERALFWSFGVGGSLLLPERSSLQESGDCFGQNGAVPTAMIMKYSFLGGYAKGFFTF